MTRFASIIVAALMPLLALAQAQTAPPLRIGVIGPFSGGSSDFGTQMRNGVILAAAEMNAVGGYMGRQLELVVMDDKGDPETGLKLAQQMKAENVVATIGYCNTGVAAKAIDVFQANHMPLIIPCATGTALTSKFPARESYIFRTSARDSIQAPFLVEDIVRRGWNRVAIFADTTGYGEAGLKDAVKALADKKLQPVYVARFALGVQNLDEDLKTAKAAGADVILNYTVGQENAVIAKGRTAMKWKVPVVGAWTLSFPFFINGAKDAAEGALMAQTFIAEPSNERRASFLIGYAKRFNIEHMPVPMAAAQAYDSTYILLYSLFNIRDGNFSGPAVKSALEAKAKTYYGVVATYERPFSPDDKDALTPNMLVMGVVKKGLVTFAYREDATRNLFVQRKQ